MERLIFTKLESWNQTSERKPLILMGARQVGKTWLMEEFARKVYPQNFVELNFMADTALRESLEQSALEPQTLLRLFQIRSGKKIIPGKTLLLLDEIQESPRALTSLKFFQEQLPELAILAAGSLLGLSLRRKHGTRQPERQGSFPVGKVEFLDVRPMTFAEFLLATGEELKFQELMAENWELIDLIHDDMVRLLRDYLFVGGMPEAVKVFADSHDYHAVRTVQSQILKAYDKDFVRHAEPSLLGRIRLLWNNIPAQLAKENKKFIYNALKEGARGHTYEEALQWLDDAGMVTQVFRTTTPRMPLKACEDFSAFKLYMHDVGLLGALSGLPPTVLLEGNALFTNFKGALTEQYALQELLAAESPLAYWTSKSGDAEVDFLLQGEKNIIPLEVKAERNLKAKSLSVFRELCHPPVCYRTSLAKRNPAGKIYDLPLYAVSRIPAQINSANHDTK